MIKAAIREWVRHTFGVSEVENPSWDINELAKHLEARTLKRIPTVFTVDMHRDCDCEEQGRTVLCFSSAVEALRTARTLNREEGFGGTFTEEGDLEELLDEDNYLWYDTGSFEIYSRMEDIYYEKN